MFYAVSCVFDASPTQYISSLKRFYCASFSCLTACENEISPLTLRKSLYGGPMTH